MKLRVFTLDYVAERGFDDRELAEFSGAFDVFSCSDHFYTVGDEPKLSVLVSYRDPHDRDRKRGKKVKGSDPREKLGDDERVIYDRLRSWRKLAAEQEGVPVYLVASNRELAAIVTRRPATKTELMSIERIGPAKLQRHGDIIMKVLSEKEYRK
jgi:superfamily II DNA helicase RecQ